MPSGADPSVSIREVGPRDGLQNEDPVPTDAKVRLLDALSEHRRARGSRRSRSCTRRRSRRWPTPTRSGQRADKSADVRYSALVPNSRGAQRALDAGFREIEVVVSASDTHNRRNLNRSTAESLDDIAALIRCCTTPAPRSR